LCAFIGFTERIGGVCKSRFQGFDFIPLRVDFFGENAFSSGESGHAFIVFVKLARNKLHFTAEDFERLIDFAQRIFEGSFALDTYFQSEIVSGHAATPFLKYLLTKRTQ
jgi:hypothetical protein